MRKALLYLADRLLWAALVLVIVLAAVPDARARIPVVTKAPVAWAFSLSSDTPVTCYWRTADGGAVGSYTTTLGKLNDVGREITDHEARLDDVERLLNGLVPTAAERAKLGGRGPARR